MSLRNMGIGLRASLSFGVLASLLIVVGLFGLGQMAKLRESALIIEESWMPSIENIHDSAPMSPASAWKRCACSPPMSPGCVTTAKT